MKTSWDLSKILPDDIKNSIEAHREKVEAATKVFVEKWKDRTDYLEDPKALKEALDEYEAWTRDYGEHNTELFYYGLAQSLDLNDPEIKSAYNIVHDKAIKLYNDIQFFALNISKIPKADHIKFLSAAKLSDYKHFLEQLFRSGVHTLSEPEERILNLKSKVSSGNWKQMLQGLLAKQSKTIKTSDGEREQNFSEITELLSNEAQEIRDGAAEAFNEILVGHLDVAENEFNSVLENKKINDDLRNYSRADEGRHISDDVESRTVDTLVEAVVDNLDIAKEYYSLKAKLFGKEKLAYHERNVEYGESITKYPFEEAYSLVENVFKKLDPRFSKILSTYFANGQVDVFPGQGKRSGAFCSAYQTTLPVFVFLNHIDSLNNVLTLAHEFGHAIHFEMSKIQNELNYHPSLALAETASTFFEDFVLEEVMAKLEGEEKLAVLMMKLNDDVSTIIRQISFYQFETEIHETFRKEGYLSHQKIGEIFQKHMTAYMGDGVRQDPGAENWWLYIPHFRTPFYVFSYAFGLLVSKSLQHMVREDKSNIEKVKMFLSSGGVKSPKDLMADLDIDIDSKAFWESGLQEVRDLLEETKALAKELGKI